MSLIDIHRPINNSHLSDCWTNRLYNQLYEFNMFDSYNPTSNHSNIGLEVGWYEPVCHTGTSLAGVKPYRHLLFMKFHTGMTHRMRRCAQQNRVSVNYTSSTSQVPPSPFPNAISFFHPGIMVENARPQGSHLHLAAS